jgi:hypothetical protein
MGETLHRPIAATIVAAWLMPVLHAQAGDASLVIEDNAVRLSVSATPPGNSIGPLALVGAQVWYGARSGRADIAVLRSTPSGGVEIAGAAEGLMLAYTQPAMFAALQEPSDDSREVSDLVLHRAQALGSKADHLRVTRIAHVDLDKTPGIETVFDASSWPPPGSTSLGRPLDFVGIFIFSEDGQPLSEMFSLRGREDQAALFSREIVALAKSPLDDGWDFLIEEKFVNSNDEAGEDANPAGSEASGSLPAQTFYRSVEVWRYLAGEFDFRRHMSWIKSKTCFGTGCQE